MVKLVSGVSDRLCANCYGGGVTRMKKLPRLNEVYMCNVCSGTEYWTPEETTALIQEEEEEN